MVGAHANPEPAPIPLGCVPPRWWPRVELLDAQDYDTAWRAYHAAPGGRGLGADPTGLNRAVDAVTPVIAAAVLERMYRRLLVLAETAPVVDSDAQHLVEVGLRIAAAKTRGFARQLAGEDQ